MELQCKYQHLQLSPVSRGQMIRYLRLIKGINYQWDHLSAPAA